MDTKSHTPHGKNMLKFVEQTETRFLSAQQVLISARCMHLLYRFSRVEMFFCQRVDEFQNLYKKMFFPRLVIMFHQILSQWLMLQLYKYVNQ